MHFTRAVCLLVGCIIGAGVLGVPYAMYKGGFLTGLLVLALLVIVELYVNLSLAEITLRTKEKHELTGYAQLFLGKWGKYAMTAAITIGIYGSLLAYLIGESEVLYYLFGIPQKIGIIIFFLAAGILLFIGLRAIDKTEELMVAFLGLITLVVFAISIPKLNPQHLTEFSPEKFFIPYGVIFFALNGMVAIPEMRQELIKHKRQLKKAVFLGTIIPPILYILFAIAVVGTSASHFGTGAMANLVVQETLGKGSALLLNIFAFLSLGTSFLALALGLQWVFSCDFKINRNLAWALTMLPPLAIALAGMTNFVKVLGFVGAFAGGGQAILILLMHRNAKKSGQRHPEYQLSYHPAITLVMLMFLFLGIFLGTL